jgi:hypothetical protein
MYDEPGPTHDWVPMETSSSEVESLELLFETGNSELGSVEKERTQVFATRIGRRFGSSIPTP